MRFFTVSNVCVASLGGEEFACEVSFLTLSACLCLCCGRLGLLNKPLIHQQVVIKWTWRVLVMSNLLEVRKCIYSLARFECGEGSDDVTSA